MRRAARACLQELHTGHACGAAPAPRWHYSVAHVDCVVFAYLGCGGNDNNFRSYEDCADACRIPRTGGDGTYIRFPPCADDLSGSLPTVLVKRSYS